MKPPRTKLLGRVNGLRVYLVSGKDVRNQLDIDFTAGGHGLVYSYVPDGEIWIDDVLGPLDRTATVLHEVVEHDHMLKYNMPYDHAHDLASATERTLRAELARRPQRSIDLDVVRRRLRAPVKKTGRELDAEIAESLRRANLRVR